MDREISNSHRGPEAQFALEKFNHGLDEAKFSPLIIPMLNRFIQLATQGSKKPLGKKHGDEDALYFGKIHFDLLKTTKQNLGIYKGKHGVHINIFVNSNYMVSTFLHEAIHYIIIEESAGLSATPQPKYQWNTLAYEMGLDLPRYLDQELIPIHLAHLQEKDGYELGIEWVDELPSRLAEHILLYGELPLAEFPQAQKNMKKLFTDFSKQVEKSVLQEYKTKPAVSPIDLYKKIIEAKVDIPQALSFIKSLPDAKVLRNMGIFPLHIAASQGNIPLLHALLTSGKYKIDDFDKLHNSALHCAIKNKQNEAADLLLQLGAGLAVYDENYKTPLMLAWEYNKEFISNLLDINDKSHQDLFNKMLIIVLQQNITPEEKAMFDLQASENEPFSQEERENNLIF